MRRDFSSCLAGLVLAVASATTMAQVPADSPVTDALTRADAAIQRIVDIPARQRTFENTLGALDDVAAQVELDVNMTMFMAYVSTDAAERERGLIAEEHVSNWAIDLQKREDLYNAVKAYADTNPRLEGERQRLLEHTLRDYRRAGMALPRSERDVLAALEKEIAKLGIDFDKNIREDETRVPLTRDELDGMSADYLATLPRAQGMYLVGLSYPEFIPIMDQCTNETTRQKMWIAYKRKGGEKNVAVLEQMLAKRAEQARLLGYPAAADYEIEVRMAKNSDTVRDFYAKLRPLVRQKAERDYAEIVAVKRADLDDPNAELNPWDTSYYMNVLRKQNYAVDMEEVRQYFPLERVLEGMFDITQSLFGLSYKEITDSARAQGRPMWHPDVRLFEVYDTATRQMLGEFYLDLHPRPNKYGHAAQWGLSQHKVWSDGTVNKPLAALVCNFTKPTADKPSLMNHDEVETFFHEFGHCLHTILSESELWGFAGTNVERDFVEAPSQMLENWVWNANVLNTFAGHYETGAPLPSELLEGMIQAKNLGSGMLAERQFFYGLYDLECHSDASGAVDTTQLAHDLWGRQGEGVELYAAVPNTFFQAGFGHLNGYQAGYYGYQWSLVYACDMFQRFQELGMLDPNAGMYYRKRILAPGGTLDGLDLVRGYLEREPDMTAYLRHLGL